MKAVSSMGLSQSELDLIIGTRNVVCQHNIFFSSTRISDMKIFCQPRACLEHYHLLLYTEEVLKYVQQYLIILMKATAFFLLDLTGFCSSMQMLVNR